MLRRAWLWNMVAALSAGPLAACSAFSVAIDKDPPLLSQTWWKSSQETKPQSDLATAPDRPTVKVVVKQPEVPASAQIKQVAAVQQTTERELLAEPPTLHDVPTLQDVHVVVPRQGQAGEPVDFAIEPEVRAKRPIDPPLVKAVRCYMDKRPVEALDWLKAYDKSSQDLLLDLMLVAVRLTEGGLRKVDAPEATALVTQLRRLERVLERRASLVIDKMCFTQGINRFGVYRLREDDGLFRPSDWVEVYVELQNFSNDRIGKDYAVRLSGRAEISDYKGTVVFYQNFQERPDLGQSQRRDCFYRCYFPLPSNVPPGMYTLWLRIKDVPTGRTASRSLDFQVAPARGRGDL